MTYPLFTEINEDTKILNELSKRVEGHVFAGARIAAAIVRRNKILAVGFNRPKSHPFQATYAPRPQAIFLHAEVRVILSAYMREIDLSRTSLYVVRTKFTDRHKTSMVFGNSKPCSGCEKAIRDHGITRVIYTSGDNSYSRLL